MSENTYRGQGARKSGLEGLERALGYVFQDLQLLNEATTHPSSDAGYSSQRLEFLGDAVIGLCVAQMLYEQYPEVGEGELSRRRSALVRTSSLAELAEKLHLGDYLCIGGGEEVMGGRRKLHILEDAMEAVVGAVFLDAGFGAAQKLVDGLFRPLIDMLPSVPELTDAKSTLQEKVQEVPNHRVAYRTLSQSGPPHQPTFTVELLVDGRSVCEGQGASRKKAEQQAAACALAAFDELIVPLLKADA